MLTSLIGAGSKPKDYFSIQNDLLSQVNLKKSLMRKDAYLHLGPFDTKNLYLHEATVQRILLASFDMERMSFKFGCLLAF